MTQPLLRGMEYAIQAAQQGRYDDVFYHLEDQTTFSVQDAVILYNLLLGKEGGAFGIHFLVGQAEVGGRADVLTALYELGWRPDEGGMEGYLTMLECEMEDTYTNYLGLLFGHLTADELVVDPDTTVPIDDHRRVVTWYSNKGLLSVFDVPEVFRPIQVA